MKRNLIVISLLFCSFFGFQSCTRQYVCNCESTIGDASTTVEATSKKKAEQACAKLSNTTPTNESVSVGVCVLHD